MRNVDEEAEDGSFFYAWVVNDSVSSRVIQRDAEGVSAKLTKTAAAAVSAAQTAFNSFFLRVFSFINKYYWSKDEALV